MYRSSPFQLAIFCSLVLTIGAVSGEAGSEGSGEGQAFSVEDCECGFFGSGLDALALVLNVTESSYSAEEAQLDCVYDDPGGFHLRIINCSTPEMASGLISQGATEVLGDLVDGEFPPETGEGVIESSPLEDDRFSILVKGTIEEGLMENW